MLLPDSQGRVLFRIGVLGNKTRKESSKQSSDQCSGYLVCQTGSDGERVKRFHCTINASTAERVHRKSLNEENHLQTTLYPKLFLANPRYNNKWN